MMLCIQLDFFYILKYYCLFIYFSYNMASQFCLLTEVTWSELYIKMAWILIFLPGGSPVFCYKHFVNPWSSQSHLQQVLPAFVFHLPWLGSPSFSILTWNQSSFPRFLLNLLTQNIYVQSRFCWGCGQGGDLDHRNTYNLQIRHSCSPESLGHPATGDLSPGFALNRAAGDPLPWGILTLQSSYPLYYYGQ